MVRKTGLFVLVALSLSGLAWADDALLTQVTGEVRVAGKEGARAAVPLLKVTEGDTLTLGANARVQMVYLGSGRQEVWKGTGQVNVGGKEGRSASLKPEASQVPALILKQLAKTPAVGQHGKTGMVMLRSMDNLAALDQLEKDYKEYRVRAAADDTTPEIFLLSGLVDLQDYDGAKKHLEELKAKQGSQPALAPVVAHFTTIVNEATAGAPQR